eukprot:2027212-Prymnesium_polylepis.1
MSGAGARDRVRVWPYSWPDDCFEMRAERERELKRAERRRGPAVGTWRSDLLYGKSGQIRGTPRLRTSDE